MTNSLERQIRRTTVSEVCI